MLVACGGGGSSTTAINQGPDAQECAEKLKSAIVVSAKDLSTKYEKDSSSAERGFKDKWVIVDGEAADRSSYYFWLTLKADAFADVKCYFGENTFWAWEMSARAQPGQHATVCGRCTGLSDNSIVLRDCFFPEALTAFAEAQEKQQQHKTVVAKDVEAWTVAQEFVLKFVKSPSTASFGGFTDFQNPRERVKHLGSGVYRVTGWVDSQNAFGATMRTDFSLEVRCNDNDGSWSLLGRPLFVQR
jgi:hypothetical protein